MKHPFHKAILYTFWTISTSESLNANLIDFSESAFLFHQRNTAKDPRSCWFIVSCFPNGGVGCGVGKGWREEIPLWSSFAAFLKSLLFWRNSSSEVMSFHKCLQRLTITKCSKWSCCIPEYLHLNVLIIRVKTAQAVRGRPPCRTTERTTERSRHQPWCHSAASRWKPVRS